MRQSRENRLDEVGRGCPELHTVSMGMLPGASDSASGSFNPDKIRASMTRYSSEPPRCRDTTPDEEDPAHGCYVPSMGDAGLPPGTAVHEPHDCPHGKRFNGLYAGTHDSFPTISKSPSIEVRDNECQTRSSLFQQQDVIPPPPPAPRYYPGRMPMAVMVGGEPRYAYGARTSVSSSRNAPATPNTDALPHRFRAEAVIERPDRGSGALAADVIVTI